jgi:D-glycero-alpha-D-manno-heptose-7-phosphate kinase
MIVMCTPCRSRGGTDLPAYYSRFLGFVISAAINKHIYVGLNETFSGGYFPKYSGLEHAVTLDEIRHTKIRVVLRMHRSAAPPLARSS